MSTLRERPNRQTPDIIVTLGAAGSSTARREITRQGRKFMCLSASVEGVVKIGLDQEPCEFLYTQVGQALAPEDGVFDQIILENTDASSVDIHLKTTMGDVTDNRLVLVGGSLNATIVNFAGTSLDDAADVAVAAAGSSTVAANTLRRAVVIQNLSTTNNLRIGGNTPGASRGYRLAAEATVMVETKGAVKIYNEGATSTSYSIMEILA